MATAKLNRVEIDYDDEGSGGRVLLLVHGHPFDRSMWALQAKAAAAAGWRAIVPDLRGYGQSAPVRGKATLDVFARDLAELLDHVGSKQAVLAGLSMGGQIVMEFCRLFPERVTGLLLAATFARTESSEGRLARYRTAERIEAEGMQVYAYELLPKMLAPETLAELPHVAEHVLSMMLSAPAEGAAAALRGRAERPSYEDALRGMQVPALVVAGGQDSFTDRDDAEQLRQLLPRSELLWMEDAGHMPNLERSDLFNSAMLTLLNRIAQNWHSLDGH